MRYILLRSRLFLKKIIEKIIFVFILVVLINGDIIKERHKKNSMKRIKFRVVLVTKNVGLRVESAQKIATLKNDAFLRKFVLVSSECGYRWTQL